jgi:hypothetical protein
MRYEDARPLIRSGDVIALTHRRLRSFYDLQVWLVRIGTVSKYCHVAQVMELGGRLFVLEAVTPLVRMVPLSNFVKEGFEWISLSAPMSDAETERALARVGVAQYSKWQAILAGFKRLKLGADLLEECCEYVICNRRLSGVDLGDVAVPSYVVDQAMRLGPMQSVTE